MTLKITNDAARRILTEIVAVTQSLRADLGRDPLDEEIADVLIAALYHQRLDGGTA